MLSAFVSFFLSYVFMFVFCRVVMLFLLDCLLFDGFCRCFSYIVLFIFFMHFRVLKCLVCLFTEFIF